MMKCRLMTSVAFFTAPSTARHADICASFVGGRSTSVLTSSAALRSSYRIPSIPSSLHFNGSTFLLRMASSSTPPLADDDATSLPPQQPSPHSFQPGDKIQVEVINFGPLGASVDVIGLGHGEDVPLLPADAQPYATGLILQKEIAFFRQGRNNVDVVRGEILPAYVQEVRDAEMGKLDVSLRSFGGKAKSEEVGAMILERLERSPSGRLELGERSTPTEINEEFPGVSKSVYKKALGALYKRGLVKPGADSIELMRKG